MPKDRSRAGAWVVVQATDAQGQPAGIYDVRAAPEATASDGTKYSDW